MLLRSSSSPVLSSGLPQHLNFEPEFSVRIIPRSTSFSSIHMSSISVHDRSKKMTGNASETDLKELERSRPISSGSCSNLHGFFSTVKYTHEEEEDIGGGEGRGRGRGRGRRLCGSGSGGSGFRDSNGGTECMEMYYQEMIAADPGNSMILSNYARFLKEFKGDVVNAEEICGRAILTNPSDGGGLSLYADLMWQTYKDSIRAQFYFDRAVKVAPNDCHVLASYARFLWEAEDGSEESVLL